MLRLEPKLVKSVGNTRLQNVGTTFKFHCVLDEGNLPVTFEWWKNGNRLFDNVNVETEPSESMLKVAKLKPEDSGNFTCVARNNFGFDQQSTVLTVKGLFKLFHLL